MPRPTISSPIRVTSMARSRVGLFPLRNGAGFVVVHRLVHADAVLADDGIARAALVVRDTLIDPFHVVGVQGLGEDRVAGDRKS